VETKIWDAFGHAVTLNFDLLTPKSNQFISVPRCTSDKSLAKIRQQLLEISWKHKTTTRIMDGRTDGQRHGRTTRKHIASAGAYRRRRLKKRKLGFRSSVFKNQLWRFWDSFSHCLIHKFILQHYRINSQRIFLHAVSLHFG